MSVYATTWVYDHSQARNGARLVLLAIADSLNQNSGRAWLSMTELQRKAALARSSVNEALTTLRALGEIEAVEEEIGPRGQTVYRMPRFQPELPAWRDGVTGTKCVPVQHGGESAIVSEIRTSTESELVRNPAASGTEFEPVLVGIPDSHTSIRKPESNRKRTKVQAAPRGGAAHHVQSPLVVGLPEPPESEGQRVNRLARAYTDHVPLSSFNAVAGVVRKAVRATDSEGAALYSDEQIERGLAQLADTGWSVTANTLRTAMQGPPRATQPVGRAPWQNPYTEEDYQSGWGNGAQKAAWG